jgi:hypothetical protein
MRLYRFAILALALGVPLGCVKSSGLSAEDKEKLKANILDSEPADMGTRLDVNFENKFRLLGAKIDPPEARPGTEVHLTYYWKCDDTVDDGWLLFTHIRDPILDKRDNLDANGPLRQGGEPGGPPKQLLPPSKWEKGKVYVDEQTYKVPDWVKAPELEVLVGIWKGDARLRILTGPNDGDSAAIVGKIKTGIKPPEPPKHTEVPSITTFKLAQNDKIAIDGKGDDKAWGGAPLLGPFVLVGSGEPPPADYPIGANAKLTWDDQNLYVLVTVTDNDVIGGFDDKTKDKDKEHWTVKGQPMLWTRETIELMFDPDGDGDNDDYYEIQINPQNKVFHAQYDHFREPLTEPNGPYGHEEWDPKLKSAVVVNGTLDKPDDKDQGFVVEAAIPWTAFGKAKAHPPKEGDTWRINLYAMRSAAAPAAGGNPLVGTNATVAWSAILNEGSFHKSSRFGRVTFSALNPTLIDPATGVQRQGRVVPGMRGPFGGPALVDPALSKPKP